MPPVTPRVPKETPLYKVKRGAPKWAQQVAESFEKWLSMHRTWVIFLERLGNWVEITENLSSGELKATFGLVRLLTVENDLTNHFICRTGGDFTNVAIDAKTPPTGSTARFRFQISTDQGSTWNNIIGGVGYVEITAGLEGEQIFTPTFAITSSAEDNLLRIDCTQIGSTYAGKNVEVVLRWE